MNNLINDNLIEEYIIRYYKSYPFSEIQDYFKFIYQASYGPKHMVVGIEDVKKGIISESKSVSDDQLIYDLNDKYVRVDLNILNNGISVDQLSQWFIESCSDNNNNEVVFNQYLLKLIDLVDKQKLPFDKDIFNNELRLWKEKGFCTVHHSDNYNKYYNPHYRLIKKSILIEDGIMKE